MRLVPPQTLVSLAACRTCSLPTSPATQALNLSHAGCVVRGQRKPLTLHPKAPRAELGVQRAAQCPVPGERDGSLSLAPQQGAMR